MRGRVLIAVTGLALAFAPISGLAQETSPPAGASSVLTLNWDELYNSSLWGQRVKREIAAASADLRKENDRIAGQLEAEERDLTTRRASMVPADFQAAADAFDKRATEIRAAQKAKADAIQTQFNAEQQAFVQTVMPMLDEVLRARGAVVVLDSRVIIRGLAEADVTKALAARVDKEIGDGAGRVKALVPPAQAQGTPSQAADTQPGDTTTNGEGTGGVFVDDSPNKQTGAGGETVLRGGQGAGAGTPLDLPLPGIDTGTKGTAQ